jgi:imidazoleglycerol-phosphate dehydratase/histidinol-phosphatase
MTRYLFIDRDGTLVQEPSDRQIDSLAKFRLLDGVVSALAGLAAAGYRLVMITNQDGLGSAANPRDKFEEIQGLLLGILESQGARFDKVLVCPHLPSDDCACRKPKIGLVREYLAANEMDRARSFVIGDRATDLELADKMGLKGFRVSPELSWAQIANLILRAPRQASVARKTRETEIELRLALDGGGRTKIDSSLPFLDHMLEQLAAHGGLGLELKARGDLQIDDHHLVEDIGLALGGALREAVGDKFGIERYGFYLPMDEAICQAAIDLSGRPAFRCDARFPRESVGGVATDMFPHFFRSFSDAAGLSLHIEARGENAHHIAESMFKAVGRCLRGALARSGDAGVPSTKGVL